MAYTNGTHPNVNVETPPSSHWERWQAYNIAHHGLPPARAAEGFTLLKFPPSMRPAFFDLVRLIIARARLEAQLVHVLEQDAATAPALHEAMAAWTAWQRYTVQLARVLERRAQGRQATLPPIPPEFQTLATALDENEEAIS